jgi:heterodisulfide reductase subunit C
MRSLLLNDPTVLESKAIWLCAGCQTCASRCPQDINVTGVMDSLRIEAGKRGITPAHHVHHRTYGDENGDFTVQQLFRASENGRV